MNFVLKSFYIIVLCSGFSEANLCSEGYLDFNGVCSPVCAEKCPETLTCIEPNNCGCIEGYHLVGSKCMKKCEPKFTLINGTYCQPRCRQKCTNGFCAAPDTCHCNSGYQLNSLSQSCEPICNEACGTDAYCSAPNKCTCKPRFHGNAMIACQPWCSNGCKNGDCIGLENCVCHEGFEKYHGVCAPFCSKGCRLGDCLSFDNCKCWDEGHKLNEITGECEEPPIAPKTLFMRETNVISTPVTEDCVGQSICQNNLSSSTELTSSREEDSTHAISTTVVTLNCQTGECKEEPVSPCSKNCSNGICTSAGICQCNQGFVKASSIHCQVTTQDDSLNNEECISENICRNNLNSRTELTSSSEEDFTHDILTTDVTVNDITSQSEEESTFSKTDVTSNCQNGCWGGSCTEGICQCPEGLVLNHHTNDCIMPCEHNCQNGVCNQENMCECNQGFVLRNGSGCVPQCGRGCVNSICVAPIHCECFEGDISKLYLSSALSCLPTCEGVNGELGCFNGTCVAVNKCQCFDGFVLIPGNLFECVPDYVHKDFVRRKIFSALLWSILLLALLIIILLGFLAKRRIRRVSYNVDKIEKCRSTVMFQNYDQPECVL